jgi:hypothetical protein
MGSDKITALIEQMGTPKTLYTGTVAVGGGFTVAVTVPANKRWILHSMMTDYTCSATAGNRIIFAFIYDASSVAVWASAYTAAITANQIGGLDITFGAHGADVTTKRVKTTLTAVLTGDYLKCTCPIRALEAGCKIDVRDSANVSATDTVTASVYGYEIDL